MRVNDYGVIYAQNTGFDLSAFTALSLVFTKPDGTTLTVTNPSVAVGAVALTVKGNIFPANEYITYTFANGDVTAAGNWMAQLVYTDSTPRVLHSAPATFYVGS